MFFVICWLSVCICRGGYYPPVAFICILYRCLVRFISSIPAIICILILLLYMPKRTTSWQGEGGKNKTAAKVSISLPLPASRYKAKPYKDCTESACIFSAILHINPLTYASMPAEFLHNLTKNLTAHLQHNLCTVLPFLSGLSFPSTTPLPPFADFCFSARTVTLSPRM